MIIYGTAVMPHWLALSITNDKKLKGAQNPS